MSQIDRPISDLIRDFAIEYAKYWDIEQSLTLRETQLPDEGRRDLVQLLVADALEREILARPEEEALKLRTLLEHAHPGVQLAAAFALEKLAPDDAASAYKRLIRLPPNADGSTSTFAARASAGLDRIEGRGIDWSKF